MAQVNVQTYVLHQQVGLEAAAKFAQELGDGFKLFLRQELILREALDLDDAAVVNPSGGATCANPMMVAGLARIGEATRRIRAGGGRRAVAHATQGPCLQQNLVCVLEGE